MLAKRIIPCLDVDRGRVVKGIRFVSLVDAGDPVAQAYGPNYARLRQIKAKYDPTNFFHMNQNIKPA